MNIIELARRDTQKITQNKASGFGWDIKLIAPNGTELDLIGLATKHNQGFDTDGNFVNSKNVHVSITTDQLIAGNYPYIDAEGEINLSGHQVKAKFINDVEESYIVREFMPDETLGLIVIILGDYE